MNTSILIFVFAGYLVIADIKHVVKADQEPHTHEERTGFVRPFGMPSVLTTSSHEVADYSGPAYRYQLVDSPVVIPVRVDVALRKS